MKTDKELVLKGFELCAKVITVKTQAEANVLQGWMEALTWMAEK